MKTKMTNLMHQLIVVLEALPLLHVLLPGNSCLVQTGLSRVRTWGVAKVVYSKIPNLDEAEV